VRNCNNPNTNKPPGKTFGPGQSNGSSFVSFNLSNSILITYKHANAPTANPIGVTTSLSLLINANAVAHPAIPGASFGKSGRPIKSEGMRWEFRTPSAPKTKAKERFCCATASATCGSIAFVRIDDDDDALPPLVGKKEEVKEEVKEEEEVFGSLVFIIVLDFVVIIILAVLGV
jgi:hypothetical protein